MSERPPQPPSSEAELESFRRRWREEVSARARTQQNSGTGDNSEGKSGKRIPFAPPAKRGAVQDKPTEYDPGAFHDLEDKEDYLKLGNGSERARYAEGRKEPRSALEHYEKAVERETQGNLGDSLNLYRKAFRLDDRVHETYKNKHFPPTAPKGTPSGTATNTVSSAAGAIVTQANKNNNATLAELIDAFSLLSIPPEPPETDISSVPPCPIARLPEELLSQILTLLALHDPAHLSPISLVCRRLAYLTMTEDALWRALCLTSPFGFSAMHYHYTVDIAGHPLLTIPAGLSPSTSNLVPVHRDLTPAVYATYRAQFRIRPRIRFNGCYISTVNYTRPGAASQTQLTWNSPVHIVTYYRYLRFFRDGSLISLLTTAEPADVVHHLTKENLARFVTERGGSSGHHGGHSSRREQREREQREGAGSGGAETMQQQQHHATPSGLPHAVMRDARIGRWRLSGASALPSSVLAEDERTDRGPGEYAREMVEGRLGGIEQDGSETAAGDGGAETETWRWEDEEEEGDVFIETEGVIPKYMYKMQFALASAGRKDGARNNKLVWKGYWHYNRLTDDWGEFGLKNDRAYYWSRVKSYTST